MEMPNILGVHANNNPGWFSIYDEVATIVDIHVRLLGPAERAIVPAGTHWREERVNLYVSADNQRIYAVDKATLTVLNYQLLDVLHGGGGGSMGAMRSDVVVDYRWYGDQRYENDIGLDPVKRLGDFVAMTPAAAQQLNASGYFLSNLMRFNIGYFKHLPTSGAVGQSPSILNNAYKAGLDKQKQKGGPASPGVVPGAPAAIRLNAGTVMQSSATNYAQVVTGAPQATVFEWCHLIGHGDGGAENAPNFVAGTHYANTNQLAIEVARRAQGDNFRLKVTAYVDPNTHLARYIRYKIYKNAAPQANEVVAFDHVFDAMSHGFDYNEFKILKDAVTRALV